MGWLTICVILPASGHGCRSNGPGPSARSLSVTVSVISGRGHTTTARPSSSGRPLPIQARRRAGMDVLDTFLITVLAALPGALFTFAYERQTRIVWAAISDRIMRLTAASAIFYVAT